MLPSVLCSRVVRPCSPLHTSDRTAIVLTRLSRLRAQATREMKPRLMMLLLWLPAGVLTEPVDDSSIAATLKAMQEQTARQEKTIAALTAALEAKATDHKQHVQLTTGCEVEELVSNAAP